MDIYSVLNNLNISYKKFEHPAVFTNEESSQINIPEVQQNAKNLFLKNHNKSKYYLLTIGHNKRADLKVFAQTLKEKSLSFGSPEDLKKFLGLTPGSVSPLGLINDLNKKVEFWLDEELEKNVMIYIHPNINTGTLGINMEDFKKIIIYSNHSINLWKKLTE